MLAFVLQWTLTKFLYETAELENCFFRLPSVQIGSSLMSHENGIISAAAIGFQPEH